MNSEMRLGDFLAAYLQRIGVTDIFGIPGDLVLGLLERLGEDRKLNVVTLSHEPSVGFAADGYARTTRRLGVVCVTYGAGGHNVVNPVAGAYAERVPLLVISGGPGEAETRIAGVHHQAKHIEGQLKIFEQVTCASHLVHHPERAAEEIHDVVRTIMEESRPGYLEIHRDLVDMVIPVPEHIRNWDGSWPPPSSDPRRLSEAVAEAVERLRAAERPILFAGVDLFREHGEASFLALAEKLRVPVVTTMLAKGVFPMDHPLHMGVHIGPFSPEALDRRVRDADLVLALGTQLTDMNLGATKPQVPRELSIWATPDHVNISFHSYAEVRLADFVDELSRQSLPNFGEKVEYCDNLDRPAAAAATQGSPITVNEILLELNEFLGEHDQYNVLAESGDAVFGGLELRLHGGLYVAQGYYASMGFGLPAALGAEIGGDRRSLLLMGDGAFQMTGPEISHAPRLGLKPIVVLVNNSGWGIFRPVSQRQDLLELPVWPYAEMAEGWGGKGMRVQTRAELREALRVADAADGFAIVECVTQRDDLSPLSRRYIAASIARAQEKAD